MECRPELECVLELPEEVNQLILSVVMDRKAVEAWRRDEGNPVIVLSQ